MLQIKDKSLIFRKYILYIDVSVKQNLEIEVGQKLNSFFGQVGIFENTEKILDYVNDYINSINVESIFFNSENFDADDESVIEEEEDNQSDRFVFYLPLTLIFYYGDKKVDFYLYSGWHKSLCLKNLKNLYVNNYKKFIINKKLLFKDLSYFFKLNKLNKYFYSFSELNYYKSKFILFFNKNCFNFFTQEFLHNIYYDEYLNYKLKKINRMFFFKKIKFKNKNILIDLNKRLSFIKNDFIIYFNIIKLFFVDNYSDDSDIFYEHVRFLSKIYNFKNNFYKKFKRKKKFKKKVVKNFLGKKFTFFNVFNSIENLKKKKRK